MPDLRKLELNPPTDCCVEIKVTPEREGPFADVRGAAQGARTDGRPRSGGIEAGSKPKVRRGFGAARGA